MAKRSRMSHKEIWRMPEHGLCTLSPIFDIEADAVVNIRYGSHGIGKDPLHENGEAGFIASCCAHALIASYTG